MPIVMRLDRVKADRKTGDIIDWMSDEEYIEAFGSLPSDED